MKHIYKTTLVSRRHKECGYCEEADFGSITLTVVSDEEASLVCEIKDYREKFKLRIYDGSYWIDYDRRSSKPYFEKRQNHFTEKTALRAMVEVRGKHEKDDSFYPAYSEHYILVGRTLYKRYCKQSELSIDESSNTLFANWYSIQVQSANPNCKNTSFNRANFEKVVAEARKWLEEKGCPERPNFSFSYPKITWATKEGD